MRAVQICSCKFIDSVFSNESCKVVHGEEVWIIPAWSNEGITDTSVWDLVVSLEH
jgi:hypothetical protein